MRVCEKIRCRTDDFGLRYCSTSLKYSAMNEREKGCHAEASSSRSASNADDEKHRGLLAELHLGTFVHRAKPFASSCRECKAKKTFHPIDTLATTFLCELEGV